MDRPSPDLPEAYMLTNHLVGPFVGDTVDAVSSNQEALQEWQTPYYQVALQALRRVSGQAEVPDEWVPSPVEGAELYRDLADERKMHRMIKGLKDYIDDYRADEVVTKSEKTLRDDQMDMFEDLVGKFTKTGTEKQLTVKASTGSGKTGVIVNFVRGLKYKEEPSNPVRTLILVPSAEIGNQTLTAFEEFGPEIIPGAYYAKKKEIRNTTVMTYRSFILSVRSGKLKPDMFDVVIKDEEHESGGPETGAMLKSFCENPVTKKRKVLVGFSATPRETEEFAYESNVVEDINRGILSPFRVRKRFTKSKIHLMRENVDDEGEYTEEELAALVHDEARNRIIIEEVLSGLKSGRRVAVRCLPGEELAHPKLIQERLNNIKCRIQDPYSGAVTNRKVRALIIQGSMRSDHRRLILKAYNNAFLDGQDGLDVVLFVGTLHRGWDSPINKKVINACPVRKAWTLKEQLMGRITRFFKRLDGSLIYGEAVDIVDEAEDDEVLFEDIVNRYAPEGKRYVGGSTIGPGLRDPTREAGFDEVFEDIPPDDLAAFRAKQETWRPVGYKKPRAKRMTAKEIEEAIERIQAFQRNQQLGEAAVGVTPESPVRDVNDSIQANPFDTAEFLTAEIAANAVLLNDAVKEISATRQDVEDIIIDRNLRVYKDSSGGFYITRSSMRRIRTWLDE